MQDSRITLSLLMLTFSIGLTHSLYSMKRNSSGDLFKIVDETDQVCKRARHDSPNNERVSLHHPLGFSPYGNMLLTTCPKRRSLTLLEAKTGFPLFSAKGEGSLLQAVVSADDTWVLSAWENETCFLSNITRGIHQKFSLKDKGKLYKIALSRSGTYALLCLESSSHENQLYLWDSKNKALIQLPTYDHLVHSVAFSSDEKKILIGSHNLAELWDLEANAILHSIILKPEEIEEDYLVTAVAFSPSGDAFAFGVSTGLIFLYNSGYTGKPALITNIQDESLVSSLTFSDNGQLLLVSSQSEKEGLSHSLLSLSGRTTLLEIEDSNSLCAAINRAGTILFTALEKDRGIQLFDVSTGEVFQENKTLLRKEGDLPLLLAALSSDGSTLITNDTQNYTTALIWDMKTGSLRKELKDPENKRCLKLLKISPSGELAITESKGGMLRLWDTKTGEILVSDTHKSKILCAAFSPDGTMFSTGSHSGITHVRNTTNGALVWTLPAPEKCEGEEINCVQFSPDSTLLFIGFSNGDGYLWNLLTKKLEHHLVHTHNIKSIAFSKDNDTVFISCIDNTVHMWDLPTGYKIKLSKIDPSVIACNGEGTILFFQNPDGSKNLYHTITGKIEELDHGSNNTVIAAFNDQEGSLLTIDTKGKVYTSTLN